MHAFVNVQNTIDSCHIEILDNTEQQPYINTIITLLPFVN